MARPGGSRRRSDLVLVVHPGTELYGSDRMLLETVRALREESIPALVVLPDTGPLAAAVAEEGAQVAVVPMAVLRKAALSPRGMARLAVTLARTVGPTVSLLRRNRPSAVYVSTLTVPSWLVLSRVSGARVLCHVHEAERHRTRLVTRGLVLPLLAAHRIIANSEYSRSVLVDELPRLAERTVVVLNGVAGPPVATSPRPAVDDSLRVLYIGRLSPRKGPDVAARALRLLRGAAHPATLRVMGSAFAGYEGFVALLREENADLIAEGVLSIDDFDPDIWSALAVADVAVVPSTLPEPFGNTAVEAALAARPVVVSDIGGLPEAVAGLPSAYAVPPGDAAALAGALAEIATDWPTWRDRAVAARAGTTQRYSPRRYRADLRREITAESGPSAGR